MARLDTEAALDPAVEAEMALAELGGIEWWGGQTKWRGYIIAYTEINSGPVRDASLVLYTPDKRRISGPAVTGVTDREFQYKTLAWGIGVALKEGHA